jgi:hypothetical protein
MSETDALRELNALRDSLNVEFWDTAAYIALFAVFFGVAGEYIAQFTGWLKDALSKEKLAKASTLLLVAGLGAEMVTHPMTDANSGVVTDFLNKQAAQAYREGNTARTETAEATKETAKINERAKSLELAVEALKKENSVLTGRLHGIDILTGDRHLNADERGNLNAILKGHTYEITIVTIDLLEAQSFAAELIAALNGAGAIVKI